MFRSTDGYEPTKKTIHSAGFDIKARGNYVIPPNDVVMVKTGVFLDLESEAVSLMKDTAYIGVYIRSSLARQGLMLANGVGVIDFDYPDEIGVLIYNTTNEVFYINDKQRIAQLIIQPHLGYQKDLINANFEYSKREGGFGSTGTGKR